MTSVTSGSTAAFFERSRTDMKTLRQQAEQLQSQISSGERLTRSSDDPVAASRLRNLSRQQALSQIDGSNADRASSDLTLADSAMSDMTTAVIRAQELATQAASSTLTAEQRQSIGEELAQIHDQLVDLANSRDSNGHALFGGEASGDAYTIDASGNAVYVGTSGTSELPLGDGQSVTRSMTGPEILNFTDAAGNATNVMETIKSLSDALKGGSSDPASAANEALTSLQTGLDTLTTGQTVVGTRLSWLEVVAERRTNQSEQRTSEQTDLGSTDLTTAVANLQQVLLVLEASQSSFSKLASLSLFDSLR